MYKPASRLASTAARALPRTASARRFLTTAPPHKTSRSWKSSAARWAAAGAGLYYYNTASVFAEEPAYTIHAPPESSRETGTYPTIDAVAEQRRAQSRSQPQPSEATTSTSTSVAAAPDAAGAAPRGPGDQAEEADQQAAFNEETGQINWDCPCLGGMAHGPCGEQFKGAFSCFVYSKEEPKGVDCIEHFKTMQNCFREHPETYGAELDDEEMEQARELEAQQQGERSGEGAQAAAAEPPSLAAAGDSPHGKGEKVAERNKPETGPDPEHEVAGKRDHAAAATELVKREHGREEGMSESDSAVPKAWHDTTSDKGSK